MWKSWEEKDRCEKELLYRLFCRIETPIRRFPTRKLVLTFRLPNDYFTIVAQTSSGGEGRRVLFTGENKSGLMTPSFRFRPLLMLSQLVSRARASFDSWRGD